MQNSLNLRLVFGRVLRSGIKLGKVGVAAETAMSSGEVIHEILLREFATIG